MGEEGLTAPGKNGGTFIIDPIDGTTNFVKGLNHSGISVGYCENGVMLHGVVIANPIVVASNNLRGWKNPDINDKLLKNVSGKST